MKQLIVILSLFVLSCKESNNLPAHISYLKPFEAYDLPNENLEILSMRYNSDDLNISGYILKPKIIEKNKKYPLIIYNRGGNRDSGRIKAYQLTKYLGQFVEQGYIVMASQYRGNMFSEGKDEFGGDDINDVIRLVDIAKDIEYIDDKNIGCLGYSRGGMMNYILSKKTDLIKAYAVVGGVTDLFTNIKNRPVMYSKVMLPLIGDTVNYRNEYIARSARFWANEIDEPFLILHGEYDENVNVEPVKALVDSLKVYDKDYEARFFPYGNHNLSNEKNDRNPLINKWFDKYLKGE